MKRVFLLPLIFAMLASTVQVLADDYSENYCESNYEVCFYEDSECSDLEEPIPLPSKGERKPSKRIVGTISLYEGLEIPGIDASEIYSFEIYDQNGSCLGVFNDEADFIQAIFLYQENVMIRLTTANSVLVGYL